MSSNNPSGRKSLKGINDRFYTYIDGKLTLEKPIIDDHICIKSGLIRDLIGYSVDEKQDNNVKELIKYLCTE